MATSRQRSSRRLCTSSCRPAKASLAHHQRRLQHLPPQQYEASTARCALRRPPLQETARGQVLPDHHQVPPEHAGPSRHRDHQVDGRGRPTQDPQVHWQYPEPARGLDCAQRGRHRDDRQRDRHPPSDRRAQSPGLQRQRCAQGMDPEARFRQGDRPRLPLLRQAPHWDGDCKTDEAQQAFKSSARTSTARTRAITGPWARRTRRRLSPRPTPQPTPPRPRQGVPSRRGPHVAASIEDVQCQPATADLSSKLGIAAIFKLNFDGMGDAFVGASVAHSARPRRQLELSSSCTPLSARLALTAEGSDALPTPPRHRQQRH